MHYQSEQNPLHNTRQPDFEPLACLRNLDTKKCQLKIDTSSFVIGGTDYKYLGRDLVTVVAGTGYPVHDLVLSSHVSCGLEELSSAEYSIIETRHMRRFQYIENQCNANRSEAPTSSAVAARLLSSAEHLEHLYIDAEILRWNALPTIGTCSDLLTANTLAYLRSLDLSSIQKIKLPQHVRSSVSLPSYAGGT